MLINVQLHTSHLTPLGGAKIFHETEENPGIMEGEYIAVPQDMIALVVELPTASQQRHVEGFSIGDSFIRP